MTFASLDEVTHRGSSCRMRVSDQIRTLAITYARFLTSVYTCTVSSDFAAIRKSVQSVARWRRLQLQAYEGVHCVRH